MKYSEGETKGVRILGVMLVIASAVMFFSALFMAMSSNSEKDERVYTTATIVSAMSFDDSPPSYDISDRKTVYVKYLDKDGTIVYGSLVNGNYNDEVGKEIDVYYFEDEKDFVYVDNDYMNVWLMQISAVSSIVGLIIALDKKLQSKIFNILKKLPADKIYEVRKNNHNKQM